MWVWVSRHSFLTHYPLCPCTAHIHTHPPPALPFHLPPHPDPCVRPLFWLSLGWHRDWWDLGPCQREAGCAPLPFPFVTSIETCCQALFNGQDTAATELRALTCHWLCDTCTIFSVCQSTCIYKPHTHSETVKGIQVCHSKICHFA
jgi:hypothetical protein